MIDGIGAEHVEGALVVEGGTDGTIAVERDVVVGVGVHQQTETGIGRGVDEEVDIDIGIHRTGGGTGMISLTSLAGNARITCLLPLDKLLAGDGIRRGGIIDEDGVLEGCDIAVDDHIVAKTVDGDIASGIDGAVEGVIAKLLEVVGQQLVCIDGKVEGEVGQVLVMDAAGEQGQIAVAVVDGHLVEDDIIGDHHDGIALQTISGVQGCDGSRTVDDKLSREVDIVEGACHTGVTIGMTRNLTEEGVGEVVHEVDIRAVGMDSEVDRIMDG